MLVLLPLSCWLIVWMLRKQQTGSWRLAFLQASLLWAAYAVLVVEGLSIISAVTVAGLASVWVMALLVCGWTAAKFKLAEQLPSLGQLPRATIPVAGLLLISGSLAVIACVCPPNNYDSLSYHLSRVEHWISNGSVAHYKVNVLRQLTFNPGAEFLIMHLRLLSGSDYLSNCVQWFAMIGSVIGSSVIARQLGADKNAQILAAALCASIPIGILESTSTQNDYVTSFWLVCLTSACLSWLSEKAVFQPQHAMWTGLALGLAAFTKPTAYFFSLPIMVSLTVLLVRRGGRRVTSLLALVGCIALALNLPFLARNTLMFGKPVVDHFVFGPGYRSPNDSFAPKYAISNICRNLFLELQTPISPVNRALEATVLKVHAIMHCDASDPSSTFDAITFKAGNPALQLHEDYAGNPVHTVLLLLCMMLVVCLRRRSDRPVLLLYAGCIMTGFILFSWVLRWQPWQTRLLLPLLVLGCGFIAATLSPYSKKLQNILIGALVVYALQYVLLNATRPMLGDENIFVTSRQQNYFRTAPNFHASFASACQFLTSKHARRIGVVSDDNGWCEYPLWVLLSQNFQQQASVDGLSAVQWQCYKGRRPDALISFDRLAPNMISLPGLQYEKSAVFDSKVDDMTYHFFGHALRHTFGHLHLAVYLPDKNDLCGQPKAIAKN